MCDFIERRKEVRKLLSASLDMIERDNCHWITDAPDGALISFLY
jgi:hypothetical protein